MGIRGEVPDRICKSAPQTAYDELEMLLHQEWKFVHHVTTGAGPLFMPMEATRR